MITDPRRDAAHVGYAIGRSFGGAVQRNRMRRRLRVLFAARSSQFRPGLYLIGAQSALLTASADELGAAVTGLLHQIEKHYA